jgi:spermidine synthase
MVKWHTDFHSPTRGLSFEIKKHLYSETSPYQKIDIVDTEDFGTVMLLDDVLMVTARDEFVYHEMLSQPSLFTHPQPERVLIIGGGDCGTLSRVLWHKTVKQVIQVEIDEMVTRVAKEYFPQLTSCLSDPRAELVFCDGIEYLRGNADSFDLILVDSTDPVGFAAGLFRKDFFADCHRALKSDGILCIQSESPWIPDLLELIADVNRDLNSLFPIVAPYLAAIQTYQAGLWMFQMASKRYSPVADEVFERIGRAELQFDYFNGDIQRAAFVLPQFVQSKIASISSH